MASFSLDDLTAGEKALLFPSFACRPWDVLRGQASGGSQVSRLSTFLDSHLQSQSPWSPGSWKISEAKGTPRPKSESGARTPPPAARRCHCGGRPAWAAGNQKNQAAPADREGSRPGRHGRPLAKRCSQGLRGLLLPLLAGGYLVDNFIPNGVNTRTATVAWGIETAF